MTGGPTRPRAEGAPLGPGSVLWRIAGDGRGLMTGTRPAILQLMHPGLGAGVTDHSAFFTEPWARIIRSIPQIWGTIFATDADDGDAGAGPSATSTPTSRASTTTVAATTPSTRRLLVGPRHLHLGVLPGRRAVLPLPLTRAEKEQLYAETVTWYRRYGVSDRPVPATWPPSGPLRRDLRPRARAHPGGRVGAPPGRRPGPREPPRCPGRSVRSSGARDSPAAARTSARHLGALPDVVRRRFAIPWTNRDRVAFTVALPTLQAVGPGRSDAAHCGPVAEGTPHLDRGSPATRRRRRTSRPRPHRGELVCRRPLPGLRRASERVERQHAPPVQGGATTTTTGSATEARLAVAAQGSGSPPRETRIKMSEQVGSAPGAAGTPAVGDGRRGPVLVTLATAQFLMTLDSSVMNVSMATVRRTSAPPSPASRPRSRSTRWSWRR